MSFYFTTQDAIIAEAGANNPMYGLAASAAILAKFSDQALGVINSRTHTDWWTNSGSVGTYFLGVLDEAEATYAAIKVVKYDITSYPLRTGAETLLNVLRDNFERCIKILDESNNRKAMGVNT